LDRAAKSGEAQRVKTPGKGVLSQSTRSYTRYQTNPNISAYTL